MNQPIPSLLGRKHPPLWTATWPPLSSGRILWYSSIVGWLPWSPLMCHWHPLVSLRYQVATKIQLVRWILCQKGDLVSTALGPSVCFKWHTAVEESSSLVTQEPSRTPNVGAQTHIELPIAPANPLAFHDSWATGHGLETGTRTVGCEKLGLGVSLDVDLSPTFVWSWAISKWLETCLVA